MENENLRIGWIDEVRGLAICAMILHHIAFNLIDILALDIPLLAAVLESRAFSIVQMIFVAIFLGISGICCHLTHSPWLRVGKVFLGASAVTVVTRIAFPDATIWFGVLHCLATCMALAALFKKYMAKVPPVWGAAASLLLFLITYRIPDGYMLFMKLPASLYRGGILTAVGFPQSTFVSFDYVPLLPHLFLFSIGVFLGFMRLPKGRVHSRFFAFCGRHSLMIYLLHQPVVFGIFFLIEKLL